MVCIHLPRRGDLAAVRHLNGHVAAQFVIITLIDYAKGTRADLACDAIAAEVSVNVCLRLCADAALASQQAGRRSFDLALAKTVGEGGKLPMNSRQATGSPKSYRMRNSQ